MRIELTDEEWMSIISAERDGLPRCCANVSALRDTLITIAREDGNVNFISNETLPRCLGWVFPEHGTPWGAVAKVAEQIGWQVEVEGGGHRPDETS